MVLKIYSRYETPPQVFIDECGESMTQQQFFDETDTYAIINKYKVLGALPNRDPSLYSYGDFTDVMSLKESLVQFTELQQGFMDLPSELRRKFGDDPLNYADYLSRLCSGTADQSDISIAKQFEISYDTSLYDPRSVVEKELTQINPDGQVSLVTAPSVSSADGNVTPSPGT